MDSPTEIYLKLNTDASWSNVGGRGDLGWILPDSTGSLIRAGYKQVHKRWLIKALNHQLLKWESKITLTCVESNPLSSLSKPSKWGDQSPQPQLYRPLRIQSCARRNWGSSKASKGYSIWQRAQNMQQIHSLPRTSCNCLQHYKSPFRQPFYSQFWSVPFFLSGRRDYIFLSMWDPQYGFIFF